MLKKDIYSLSVDKIAKITKTTTPTIKIYYPTNRRPRRNLYTVFATIAPSNMRHAQEG